MLLFMHFNFIQFRIFFDFINKSTNNRFIISFHFFGCNSLFNSLGSMISSYLKLSTFQAFIENLMIDLSFMILFHNLFNNRQHIFVILINYFYFGLDDRLVNCLGYCILKSYLFIDYIFYLSFMLDQLFVIRLLQLGHLNLSDLFILFLKSFLDICLQSFLFFSQFK